MSRFSRIHRLPPLVRFLLLRVLPLVFVVAGVVCVWFGVRTVAAAKASQDWPTVPGVIVSSEVRERVSKSHNSTKGHQSGRVLRTTYHADVRYDYQVDGAKHSSDRVMFGDYGMRDSARAQSIVDRYPAGKDVVVYHAPNEPEMSVLEPGVQSGAYLLPGMGAVYLVLGTVVFVILHVKFVLNH